MQREQRSKHDPLRKKRGQPSLALAVVPDRSLATLGAYVDFPKKLYHKRVRIPAGSVGIIVRDSNFICKPGEVAVKIIGQKFAYLNVPLQALAVRRGLR